MKKIYNNSIGLFVLYFICSSLFFTTTSFASNVADAEKILQSSVTQIMNDIQSEKYRNSSTRPSVVAKIKTQVYSIFDFEEFTMRTVGMHWKKLNINQKKDFTDAFAALLFATYLSRIDDYNKNAKGNTETIAYAGMTSGNNGTRVEVRTVLTLNNNQKLPMNYRMLPKKGAWRVYDVIIENVSLVKNYRTQFYDALQNDSPEKLIQLIRAKTQEIEGGNKNAN